MTPVLLFLLALGAYPGAQGTVPLAPGNATAMVSGTTVEITWQAPMTGPAATSYRIEAGSAAGGSNIAVINTASTIPRFVTTSVPAGTYYVRVRAVNAIGVSAPSNEMVLTVGPVSPCATPPGTPSNLVSTVQGTSVTLTWASHINNCGLDSYVLRVGSAPGLSNILVFPTNSTGTTFSAVAQPGTYYVRVHARNANGESAASNEIVVTVGGGTTPPPAQPVVLVAEFRTRGPQGAADEFIEVINASRTSVDISGWQVLGSTGTGDTAARATIPAGTVLPGGCFYLLATGTYSGSAAANASYALEIPDNGGIAIVNASGVVVDAVGLGTGSAYAEGTPLPDFGASNSDRSYQRQRETNNNNADFVSRSPSNPENRSSACLAFEEAWTPLSRR